MAWSAEQYLKFEDERTRPARDLLAQVPDPRSGGLYDLGCGPGNSTELITGRFPGHPLTGVDSDDAMLDAARTRLPDLQFEKADLALWKPDAPAGLLFANAVFQWLPDHRSVLQRLAQCLAPGGTLAVQMPDNLNEPSHLLMEEVANRAEFREFYPGGTPRRHTLAPPVTFMDSLAAHAARVDLWHTVYYHRLANAGAIVEWVKGTGLRPYLAPLPDGARSDYLKAYLEAVSHAYPPMADGHVLLRFPRFFIVATSA